MAKNKTDNSVEKLKRGINGKSIGAMLVFGAIVATFVLADYSPQSSGSGTAATVNGKIISLSDFQAENQYIEQYYRQLFGNSMDFSSQRQLLQQQAMESLIRNELVAQAANAEHLYATDEDVRLFLLNDVPYLQENGQFNRDYYSRYLEYTRTSPAQFESKIRKNILELRTRRIFEAANRPLQLELDKMRALKETRINLQYLQVMKPAFIAKLPMTPSQLDADMKNEEFLKSVQENFEKNKANLGTPERVKASHILIQGTDDAALAKAQELRKQVNARNFAELAKTNSADPGSKEKGGDLGEFTREQMVKEFADAAFTLEVGTISEPVKSSFGYHIIKVNGKTPASEPSFDQQKYDIARSLKGEKAWNEFAQQADDLLKKGDEAALSSLLQQHQLKWAETGFFDLTQDTIPQITSTQAASALNDLSPEKPLLGRLIREGDSVVLLKLKAHKIEADPKLAISQNQEMLEKQRGNLLQSEWVNEYRKTSKIYTNPQMLAQ